MLQKLKDNSRLHIVLIVALSCLFSLVLLAFRIWYADSWSMRFLVWNLFLAAIPFAISTSLLSRDIQKMGWLPFIITIGTWLLFFPNAPYILTDMLHLHQRFHVPIWYDTLLMVSFAWNGFVMGLISLIDIQHIISEKTNKTVGWAFAFFAICLGSFGIYLGRFDRWNSWDILTNPLHLGGDISRQILHPNAHHQTIAVTMLFSIFIGIAYAMLRLLASGKIAARK